ncbi:MAG: PQQ-dependent sugar dehydrogenase [Terriglobales bacterium]
MHLPERHSLKRALVTRPGILVIVLAAVLAMIPVRSRQAVKAQTREGTGHYEIKPSQLPGPHATSSASNPPEIVPKPANAKLTLPPRFEISTWAEGGMENPRWLALSPNGDVFVADSRSGRILVFHDANHSGKASQRFVFASGLRQPFGMAFQGDHLYVGNTNGVVRFSYRTGQTKAEGQPEKVTDLPGRGYHEHWTRNVVFSPDGKKMYVTVGSASNDSPGEDPMRAAISEYNPDGSGHRLLATGMRNPIGLKFYPGTNQLWAIVQERDELGDDLVPDYLTHAQDGGFYGWPYAYIGPHQDPTNPQRPDLVKKTLTPDVLFQSHSAPMDVVFYQGQMFPKEFQGDAFVSLHGSWNRSKRTGYKIVRVHFQGGKPAGGYDDFITGWRLSPDSTQVWGRPVGLLVLKDGSLLIADDGADKIWRVTYRGTR